MGGQTLFLSVRSKTQANLPHRVLGGYSPLANLNVVLSLGAVWSVGHGNARSESPFFTLTLHTHAEENASECARCVRAQARTGRAVLDRT